VAFGLSGLLGVAEDLAVGAAVVSHLAVVVPLLLLGVLALARGRFALAELIGQARQRWRRS